MQYNESRKDNITQHETIQRYIIIYMYIYTFIHTVHIRNIATSILFTAHFLLPKSPPSLRSCELWHFLRLRSGWFGSLGAELFADAALWHCGDGAETPLQQFQARRLGRARRWDSGRKGHNYLRFVFIWVLMGFQQILKFCILLCCCGVAT